MKIQLTGKRWGWRNVVFFSAGMMVLSGCDETGQISNPFKAAPKSSVAETEASGNAARANGRQVERDVEAPNVFNVTDMGLWDGRPSLGGVWVAHPDVKDPERVIIRNTENSQSVIGALFRRERENPGPIMQVSSDAAEALGMLAGSPARLSVVALRREEIAVEPEALPEAATATTEELAEPTEIEATPLDPIAGAAAAIEAAEIETATATAAAQQAAPKPKPAVQPQPSSLEKPFIQIGIFSVEQNAENTATAMRQAGMVPTVKEQSSQGKKFWRVIVGPAADVSERTILLKKIKGVGFDDAYPVTN